MDGMGCRMSGVILAKNAPTSKLNGLLMVGSVRSQCNGSRTVFLDGNLLDVDGVEDLEPFNLLVVVAAAKADVSGKGTRCISMMMMNDQCSDSREQTAQSTARSITGQDRVVLIIFRGKCQHR